MIRPTAGVKVNMGGGMSGIPGSNMGMSNTGVPGNQPSGADVIRGILANGSRGLARGGTGGGFNWGSTNANATDDVLLREMLGSGNETETTNYLIENTAQYVKVYLESLLYRRAPLYNVYREALENFVLGRNGLPDRILKAFIEDVLKQHDFSNVVAFNGAPFFGGHLVETLRGGKEQLNMQDVRAAIITATRNVLYFELISWLVNSDSGRSHVRNLTEDVSLGINKLEQNKEIASTIFGHYGVPNPYAEAKFEIKAITAPDYFALSGELTNVASGGFHYNDNNSQSNDLTNWILERSNNLKAGSFSNNLNTPTVETTMCDWGNQRTDYENLSLENIKEFNIVRFFKHIKDDYYFIEEEHFKNIKHVLKLNEGETLEDVIGNSFRVLKIDLYQDALYNYTSTLIRDDNLTITDVLTDPRVLLPKLENPNHLLDVWSVRNEVIEKVEPTLEDELEKLGVTTPRTNGTTVVTYKPKINAKGYEETVETITKLNTVLTKETKTVNSVYSLTNYSTFDLRDPKHKPVLRKVLPYLFTDYGSNISYEALIKGIVSEGKKETITGELYHFLDSHLTKEFNNYLVGSLGYSATDMDNHLSVGSIFNDIDKLLDYVIDKDKVLYELLTTSKENYLTANAKLFTYDNRFRKEDDPLKDIVKDKEVLVERDSVIGVINNLAGPVADKEPLVIFKSTYPEYFSLLETGVKELKGDANIRNVTKLLYFSNSKELWLFSLSELDDNMGKLTLVDITKPLVLMNLYS